MNIGETKGMYDDSIEFGVAAAERLYAYHRSDEREEDEASSQRF